VIAGEIVQIVGVTVKRAEGDGKNSVAVKNVNVLIQKKI